jgi:hypothetical protein
MATLAQPHAEAGAANPRSHGLALQRLRPWLVSATLAIATAALRAPLAGRYLFNWDAIQFALGVQHFNLGVHRPHPPGYIGYVALGRVFTALAGGDPQVGLVWLSIVAEAATVVAIYLVARSVLGESAGIASALLLLTSPLYWLYGETALTYSVEPLLVLVAFWLALRCLGPQRGGLVPLALMVGASGAIRPTTEALLVPLLAYATYVSLRQRRRSAVAPAGRAMIALAVASIAWVIPLLWLSGGLPAYLRASTQLSARASSGSALWRAGPSAALFNANAVLSGLLLSLGVLALLAVSALVARLLAPGHGQPRLPHGYAVLLGLVAIPTIATDVLVHIGQLGYVLFFVPPVLLASGMVFQTLGRLGARRDSRLRRRLELALLAACVALNLVLFAVGPDSAMAQLRDRDQYVSDLLPVASSYAASTTLLATDVEAQGSYRLAQYYLQGYAVAAIGRDRHGKAGEMYATTGPLPEYTLAGFDRVHALAFPQRTAMLILDEAVLRAVGDRSRLETVKFGSHGERIWRAALDPADPPVASGSWIYIRGSDCPCQGGAAIAVLSQAGQPR